MPTEEQPGFCLWLWRHYSQQAEEDDSQPVEVKGFP